MWECVCVCFTKCVCVRELVSVCSSYWRLSSIPAYIAQAARPLPPIVPPNLSPSFFPSLQYSLSHFCTSLSLTFFVERLSLPRERSSRLSVRGFQFSVWRWTRKKEFFFFLSTPLPLSLSLSLLIQVLLREWRNWRRIISLHYYYLLFKCV